MKKQEKPKESGKKEGKKHDRQLKNVLMVLGGITAFILIMSLVVNSMGTFTYRGVDFKMVSEGNLIFYNAYYKLYGSLTGKYIATQNVYIRHDPRKLEEEIPFEGEMHARLKLLVINSSSNFECNGDGNIAFANFMGIMKNIYIDVVRDETAICDKEKKYGFVNIVEGEETKIVEEKYGCYTMYVKDCDILKATERMLVESIVASRADIRWN